MVFNWRGEDGDSGKDYHLLAACADLFVRLTVNRTTALAEPVVEPQSRVRKRRYNRRHEHHEQSER